MVKKQNTVKEEIDVNNSNYQNNKELAIKGRFVVIVSVILILQAKGIITLDKLPFIGTSLKDTEFKSILLILISVLIFSVYKYWVYKRASELNSSVDILSKDIRDKLLLKKYQKIYKKALKYLLNNGTIDEFDYEIDPPYNNRDIAEVREYVSPYSIKHWQVIKITSKDLDPLYYKKRDNKTIDWEIEVSTWYSYKDNTLQRHGQSVSRDIFKLSADDYFKLKNKCDLLAYFMLPDFIEKTVPYISSICALIIGVTAILK